MKFKNPRDWTVKEYKNILQNGLKNPHRRTRSVGIVGAGMAGLVCAMLLKKNGFKVEVYEASPRVGGRVKTLREESFSAGLYAEAGAMRIPETHELTLALCKHYKLPVVAFPENKLGFVSLNNRRVPMAHYLDHGDNFNGAYSGATAESALRRTMSVFYKADERLPLDAFSQAQRKQLDSLSLGEYLRAFLSMESGGQFHRPILATHVPDASLPDPIDKEERITASDIELIALEYGASDLRASFIESYRDHKIIQEIKKFQIVGGMDLLPRAVVTKEGLTDLIRFRSRVRAVRRDQGVFQISYEHPITHVRGEGTAHYLVLAAPFSALTHVTFSEGLLSGDTLRAIRNLHYENATKIVLEFDERFWERDHKFVDGGFSFTDLPIRWVYYPAKAQNPPKSKHGLLLASYTWGEDSLRWASLKPDERIRFALEQIATLHGQGDNNRKPNYYQHHLVGGTSHSWAGDEFTFGAFAIFDPHQETDLFDHAWMPRRGVHFAGEHTSLKHAWIEGAVESGIRAACEVADEEDQ